jgi:hypothetical protein
MMQESGGLGMRVGLIFGFVALAAVLAGCGTPQERCIASATRDLRIMDRLIGEVQGNLDRGYALEEIVQTRTRWVICQRVTHVTATEPVIAPKMCLREYEYTEIRPKAINLAYERQKQVEMQKKRVELVRSSARAVASCKLTHPE